MLSAKTQSDIQNSKVHNFKIKFKRRAENEKKCKVNETDNVNSQFYYHACFLNAN